MRSCMFFALCAAVLLISLQWPSPAEPQVFHGWKVVGSDGTIFIAPDEAAVADDETKKHSPHRRSYPVETPTLSISSMTAGVPSSGPDDSLPDSGSESAAPDTVEMADAPSFKMHATVADAKVARESGAALPLSDTFTPPIRNLPGHYSQLDSRLTVGLWDDNVNFEIFAEFSSALNALSAAAQGYPPIDHRDRVRLVVRDKASGLPVAGATVAVQLVLSGSTARGEAVSMLSGSGGIVTILPRLLFPAAELADGQLAGKLVIAAGGATTSVPLPVEQQPAGASPSAELSGNLQDLLPRTTRAGRTSDAAVVTGIDVAVVLDTTGSMGDELRFITGELGGIAKAVVQRHPQVHLRFAVVLYRDIGDEYVVKGLDFTASVDETARRLTDERAQGGGDYPEAAEQALHFANDQLSWSADPGTLRLAFWIADAPHHNENAKAMAGAIVNASRRGIRIYPVAGSGANDLLEFTMRAAALATSGRYMFLTDHSGIGGAHKEPRIPCYFVTKLKHALERCIAMELAGRFVEPGPAEVITTVGDVQNRRCQTRSGRVVLAS
jgi:hypothetical protein